MRSLVFGNAARGSAATRSLQRHRFLVRSAFAIANLFAWIFIFQYFYAKTYDFASALIGVALLFALAQDVTLLFTPFSARRIRNGVKGPMMLGIVLSSAGLVILGGAFAGLFSENVGLGVMLYAILYGLYRALYWVPYIVDVAKTATHGGFTKRSHEIFFACIPALVGFVLMAGYPAPLWILFGAAATLLASLVPLSAVADKHEGFSWSYTRTYHELFTARHRKLVLCALSDGIAGAALLLFWPLAVFMIVGWSYVILGLVMSVTLLLVMVSRSLLRTTFNTMKIHESPLVHAMIASSAWIFRLVVSNPLGVVLVDSYFYTGATLRGTGIDPYIFEQSSDRGSYVDELTALKEISMAIGKIGICLFGAALCAFVALPFVFIGVFIVAAGASGVSVYLARTSSEIL